MGPAVATQNLMNSSLRHSYQLFHFKTNVHEELASIGTVTAGKVFAQLQLFWSFARFMRKCRPNLVLIPISQSTLGFVKDSVFIWVAALFSERVLIQLRGSNFKNWLNSATFLTRLYVSKVLSKCRGVVVLGERLKYLFSDYFSHEQIFVVPNGANYDINAKHQKNGCPRVLYLSNLQPTKGIEDVLKAVSTLKKTSNVNFHCDIVGAWRDRATRERCMRLVESEKLPVNFHSAAIGEEKWRYFQKADLFVFPPRAPEGHPWVIVEAMAAGLPVISTDQGAIRESIHDSKNGFIVEPERPAEIAERMLRLLENPDMRTRMGAASRRFYLEKFTEANMVEKLRGCFDSILSQS